MSQRPVLQYLYYFLLAALAFGYVLIRAKVVDMTYDEAWTISDFVAGSYFDVYNFTHCDANNHLLNSILIKVFYEFLPQTLFIARLPNIFAFFFFLFFAYKICSRLKKAAGPIAFTLLLLNPFMLEFFSLARGYGLSLGMEMGALYFFLRFVESRKSEFLSAQLLFSSLAVTASLSSIHFFLALLAVNFFYIVSGEKKQIFKQMTLLVLFTVGLCGILFVPIQKLMANDNFYYGGNSGFYSDTLLSLAKYFNGSQIAGAEIKIGLNIFILITVYFGLELFKQAQPLKQSGMALLILLGVCILSMYAQFWLLNNLFLIDRTALFFYPLLILILGYSFDLSPNTRINKSLHYLLVLFFGFNFMMNANVSATSTWFFDAHNQEIISAILKQKDAQPAMLECSWPMSKSLNYYRNRLYPQLALKGVDQVPKGKYHRYYAYIHAPIDMVAYDSGFELIHRLKKDTVLKFPKENIYLFKIRDE